MVVLNLTAGQLILEIFESSDITGIRILKLSCFGCPALYLCTNYKFCNVRSAKIQDLRAKVLMQYACYTVDMTILL